MADESGLPPHAVGKAGAATGEQSCVAVVRNQDDRAALVDDVEITGRACDDAHRALVPDDGRKHGADLPVGADGADQAVAGIGDEYAAGRRRERLRTACRIAHRSRPVGIAGRSSVGRTTVTVGRALAAAKAPASGRKKPALPLTLLSALRRSQRWHHDHSAPRSENEPCHRHYHRPASAHARRDRSPGPGRCRCRRR